MERYVCIHGHFYQPPRENPWLEDIELQDSAYPYHDWNERITDECYAPNAASRILDDKGRIKEIVNNYTKISFNFGPTLLEWMETKEPEVYKAVLDADKESQHLFSGHGSALAQCYNHMIMPLANRRDKYTQVIWGIRDFIYRFGRYPEGMWLPETAVNLETLEIMAEYGIRFTILTPYQAKRFRRLGDEAWYDVGPKGIDPSRPYRVRFKSGREMSVFFYDGPISRAIAFERLLANGERFAQRLMDGFNAEREGPQLVNVSTDGETYGHHHRYGEMALTYALHYIEANKLAVITNYGEFLEKYPPKHEVEIVENSSWSCIHGVERWRSNCGCNSGLHPGWSQAWRAPLRNALNWLRNTLGPRYEQEAGLLLKDPWAARDDYIEVILDRSLDNLHRYLARNAKRELNGQEQVRVLKLLEMQRHAMLMFTSCGWFFDDISGIETVQVLQYAGRVIQLAEELFGLELEPQFVEMLAQAKSNVPEHRDGAHIYEKFVQQAKVDLPKVGAHYAISSLFEEYEDTARIHCYLVERDHRQNLSAGEAKLTLGRARVTSEITRESAYLAYGVLYFGYHNVDGGVRLYKGLDAYEEMVQKVSDAFDRGDITEVLRLLDLHFEGTTYTLKQLFKDQQRKILDIILNSTLEKVTMDYRNIYERHAPLMRFLKHLDIPRPKALQTAAEFILNKRLNTALASLEPDVERINSLLAEVEMFNIPLDDVKLKYTLKQTVEHTAERLKDNPSDLTQLQRLYHVVDLADTLPFTVDLWKVQNIFYLLLTDTYPEYKRKAQQGEPGAAGWVAVFNKLGDKLRIRGGI